jgi:urate oxidase
MPNLLFHTYGKTRVRLLQVLHEHETQQVVDISANILLQGDLSESFTAGDNSRVLPTDTMKNTVYVIARQKPIDNIETFAIDLGKHFLDRLPHLSSAIIEIDQTSWTRIGEHSSAFLQSAKEQRTAKVTLGRDGQTVASGLRNAQLLKTSHSGFAGFVKDEYTTLGETQDRLLGTVLDAEWIVAPGAQHPPFNELHRDVRQKLLDVFAEHRSLSVQHTLYAMAEAVLAAFDGVSDIHLVMPNKHCLLFDLAKFGLDNPNQIFVPIDEPSGFIEARVSR